MRLLVWLFRAFVFFGLFAFALNNQQQATVHWFFGQVWVAPLVVIVLVAFGSGAAFGVLAMTPSWWRQRRRARDADRDAAGPAGADPATAPSPAAPLPPHLPPDGL